MNKSFRVVREDGFLRICSLKVGGDFNGVGNKGASVGITKGRDGIYGGAVWASERLCADGLQDGADL